jgi:hypothetical protein
MLLLPWTSTDLDSTDPSDASSKPVLLADHDSKPLLDKELVLTRKLPLATVDSEQLSRADLPNLLLHLKSEIELLEDGEALLSVAINGLTAVQITVTRSDGRVAMSSRNIVTGLTKSESASNRLDVDLRNFAQDQSVQGGRSFVTFRAGDTGRSKLANFRWIVRDDSAFVHTKANSEELALDIDKKQIRRNYKGELVVPVRVKRAGGWSPTPLRVEVQGRKSHAVTIPAHRSEADVVLVGETEAAGMKQISAHVAGAFNEPNDIVQVAVPERDELTMIVGAALVVAGLGAILLILSRRRSGLIWPVFGLVVGLAVVANTYGGWTSVRVIPVPEEAVETELSTDPSSSGALSESTAERFDAALSHSTQATKAFRRCRAILVEERDQTTPLRIFEIDPIAENRVACRRMINALTGSRAPDVTDAISGAVVHVRLEDGSAQGWRWGYPTGERK